MQKPSPSGAPTCSSYKGHMPLTGGSRRMESSVSKSDRPAHPGEPTQHSPQRLQKPDLIHDIKHSQQ
jgi:hypothetical protein